MDPAVIAEVQLDIESLEGLVAEDGDAVAIRDALQRLELSAYKIAEAMYGDEGGASESDEASAAPEES